MTKFLLTACIALTLVSCGTSQRVASSAASKYTTEADVVRTMGSGDFPKAFPTENVNIRTYRDPEGSLAAYTTFDFDYTSKTNPLLEKELFSQLQKVLEKHGLTRVEKNQQITISMDFFIGKKEQYTPPTTVTSTEIKSVWNSGFLGWDVGGYNSAVPVTSSTTTPGYTTTSYYSNIRVNFLDHAKLVKGGPKLATPPLIWLGEADSEGSDPDIRAIAPVMFNELLGEFPGQSSKPAKRYVRLFRYGGLGVGFDPNDWRIVRYVEPGSVATENGIRPGDMILLINSVGTGNYPATGFWMPKNPEVYRANDPYYVNILSNHGNKDVEMVVKLADTGKKITLQVRPRGGDRYIYVDQYGNPIE